MPDYGLIGFPLGHSFSVPYFNEKFYREGIDARYRNHPLDDIEGLLQLIGSEPDLRGLNVTIPHKKSVIPFLDSLDELSREVGAVNTIRIIRTLAADGKHGDCRLEGYNTDVIGFRQSLEEHIGETHGKALVLGTGGSSGAVCYVLGKLGIAYSMVSRNPERVESRGDGSGAGGSTGIGGSAGPGAMGGDAGAVDVLSYAELDPFLIEKHGLIINTTPLGMHPNVDGCPDLPWEGVGAGHLLFDLVYNPAKTRFLEYGEERGAAIVNGYQMLVNQAEASWKIWNTP